MVVRFLTRLPGMLDPALLRRGARAVDELPAIRPVPGVAPGVTEDVFGITPQHTIRLEQRPVRGFENPLAEPPRVVVESPYSPIGPRTPDTRLAPWLRSPQSRTWHLDRELKTVRSNRIKLERALSTGVDDSGKSIDIVFDSNGVPMLDENNNPMVRTAVRRALDEKTQRFIDEVVPLRKVYEYELSALRANEERAANKLRVEKLGAPRWYERQQRRGGPSFEEEFEWLAVRSRDDIADAKGSRIQVELFTRDGERLVFPTGVLDVNDPDQIFVFGSNLRGVHGAGAARTAAQNWGAQTGVGRGLTGRAYALPTKRVPTGEKRQLEIFELENYIEEMFEVARLNPTKKFMFTPVGTGLGGYELEEVAGAIATVVRRADLPKNVYFVDVTEAKADQFIEAIAKARTKIPEEFVEVDVDKLIELERAHFGSSRLAEQSEPNFDLPQLPAPSILKYADADGPGKEIISEINAYIKRVVASGNRDEARILQAYVLRRLQSAKGLRAIVSALKDYRELAPLIDKRGLFQLGFRDAVEQAVDNLYSLTSQGGVVNSKVAADTYVYLAEEVVESRKLASFMEKYIDSADTFDELLRVQKWLDDTFVTSKLSHPELIVRGEWSVEEERLLERLVRKIEILRGRSSKYLKRRGEDLIRYHADMSEDELRKMFAEAIGTSRSLDELRLINQMANKIGVGEALRRDINDMIFTIRPILASRRGVPIRDKELRRTATADAARFVEKPGDKAYPEIEARRRGAQFAGGDQPRYSDIVGWEEGGRAYVYRPYNPEEMLRGATEAQREWILLNSKAFIDEIRVTTDLEQLRNIYKEVLKLRSEGKISGRMWQLLERDTKGRAEVVKAYLKREGIPESYADDMFLTENQVAVQESLIPWARSQGGSRRAATRYWNDPDIERRDDLSDFVQHNSAYEELIQDAMILDAKSGRSVRGLVGDELFDNPLLNFEDGLGEISILRGDIADEIVRTVNRRVIEIDESISRIQGYIDNNLDFLNRSMEEPVDRLVTRGGKFVKDENGNLLRETVPLRQVYQERIAELEREARKYNVQDVVWDPSNESLLPFGTRRIVDFSTEDGTKLQYWDFEYKMWVDATPEDVAIQRVDNRPRGDMSEAITINPDDSTLVYQSPGRVGVDASGRQFENRPLLRVFMPDGHGYTYRTYINASGSDITIAIAANWDSPGEVLTKSFANGKVLRWDYKDERYVSDIGRGIRTRYVAIDHNADDFNEQVSKAVDQLNETYRLKNDTAITVNLAGNGISTFGEGAQPAVDAYALRFWQAVMEHPRRRFVIANGRSGGQTGYDEAMMKAFLRMGLPIDVTLPRAKFNNAVMVQTPDGKTAYPSIPEYLRGLGIEGASDIPPLRTLRQMGGEAASEIPGKNVTWGRYHDGVDGFEVSTKGTKQGKQFSALNAKLKGSLWPDEPGAPWWRSGQKSIEDVYQVDIKGGEKLSAGKYSSKGPGYQGSLSQEELYAEYKKLWIQFFEENPDKLEEIAQLSAGKKLTDMYASSDVSQARAIDEILTERGLRVPPGIT